MLIDSEPLTFNTDNNNINSNNSQQQPPKTPTTCNITTITISANQQVSVEPEMTSIRLTSSPSASSDSKEVISDHGTCIHIGDDPLYIEKILTQFQYGSGLDRFREDGEKVHSPGDESVEECKICYQESPLARRSCCDYATCTECLKQYFASQVEMGSMRIECINLQCHSPIDPEEIASLLDNKLRDIYFRLIQENNCNLLAKTCPSCSTMYTLKNSQQLRTMKKMVKKDPTSSRVKCDECKYYWCFLCHAPWHQGLTCGQYRQGDRLLKVWAKQLSQGQLNAQRCPKCKTFIQKSGGCDHMHCNRCKTGFCYRCGEPLRRLKFFGDHYSKFSIFGCKYRYKKESPIQRKAIRGAVFASKLFLAPILGSLIFCAGTLFVSVAVAFLPFYGVITIYKRCCC